MTKYSIKNICLGIGIGLVLAAMANIAMTPKALSIDDIKREAKKYNLIVMDAKDLIQKQPAQSNEPEAKGQTPTTEPAPDASTEQNEPMELIIKSGSTSEGVADSLLSNKLIKSKQEFLDRLKALKKENKMQIGTFRIPKDASMDKIIDIITSAP